MAALYVLFHHAYQSLLYTPNSARGRATDLVLKGLKPLAFGHYAVNLFIVLSGYCLMLPVLRAGGALRGGIKAYCGRRMRRILPPYYAALLCSLALLGTIRLWDRSDAFPSAGDILTHVLLVHNLFNDWAHGIDPPMWSVATEWQIYFVFPLVLLPLWRKGGIVLTVLVGFANRLAAHWLVPDGLLIASPWFIGLFALGMAGATLQFPIASSPSPLARKLPWGILCLVSSGLFLIGGCAGHGWFMQHPWIIDPLFGLAAMCLIGFCVQTSLSRAPEAYPALLKVLNARGAIVLGSFSYSLYLIHYPLLDLVTSLLSRIHSSGFIELVSVFGLYPLVTIACAYLFSLLFERPFLSTPSRRSENQVEALESSHTPYRAAR